MGLKWYVYFPLYWTVFLLLFFLFIRGLHIGEYRNSVIREGEVVYNIDVENTRRYRSQPYPIYQFDYNDSVYTGSDPAVGKHFRMGEKIRIIFPKGDPVQSKIYTIRTFWLSDFRLLLFFLAGVIVYVATFDRKPRIPSIHRSS